MKRVSRCLGLFTLTLAAGFLLGQERATAAPYPVPHRGWIKLALVAYQYDMTPAKIHWAASHFDYFINAHREYLSQYRADTDAPIILYDEYYSLYTDSDTYTALQTYCTQNGLNLESMLLHYSVNTSVTYGGETHTIPGGTTSASRMLCFYGGTWSTDRVVLNVGNPNYQAFMAQYELTNVGSNYDGLFVDDSQPHILDNQTGEINSGGSVGEYPGKSWSDMVTAFDSDVVKVFQAVRTAFGTRGASGSKQQTPNIANYDRTDFYPYVDGVFREFLIMPGSLDTDHFSGYASLLAVATGAGVFNIVSCADIGNTSTDQPADKIEALATYYLIANPGTDYFCRQDSNSGDPQTYAWFGALEYNVGQPQTAYYSFSTASGTTYGRQYTRALVLLNLGGSSRSYALPTTADNPTGMYYALNADGTLSTSPITSIALSNEVGAILIKESALNADALTLTKSADKTAPRPGDVVTYTISYSNTGQSTLTSAQLVDAIPANTTYVAGSASNGGSYDGARLTWLLGSLVPGASGTVTFRVTVN